MEGATLKKILLAVLWFGLPTVALAQPPKPWPVQASRGHAQCPWKLHGPTVAVIKNGSQWQQLMSTTQDLAAPAPVNWRTQDLIIFALSEQPHLGVAVSLAPTPVRSLRVETAGAHLQVQVTQPAPDSLAAMAMSNPCVMALVPKRKWRRMHVHTVGSDEVLWQGPIRVAPAW
jgi:hypothetical protein